jgi:hypothetical protein
MERAPSIPEGILLMMGPRTLEGGYSPSQKVSSAFKETRGASCALLKATWLDDFMGEVGTKALQAATIKERSIKLSLDMVFDCCVDCGKTATER